MTGYAPNVELKRKCSRSWENSDEIGNGVPETRSVYRR